MIATLTELAAEPLSWNRLREELPRVLRGSFRLSTIAAHSFMSHTFQKTPALATQGRIVDTARQRILHQPHLTVQRIWCDFDEGKLFLRGQVPSFYYKQLAQEAVARIDGVSQVVNEIEVVW